MMAYCPDCKKDRRHRWDEYLNKFICLVCERKRYDNFPRKRITKA